MLNIIRADLYRIFRSKGFYITIALLFVFLVSQTITSQMSGVFVNNGPTTNSYTYNEDGSVPAITELPNSVGITAPFKMMGNADILLYFLLPFIIFVAAADFSTDTVKNVLANGMPRVKYYLSKLIFSCVFCFFILLLNIIVPIITATILHGFGGKFDIEFIGRMLRPFLAQFFMFVAVTCVGIFFVFVTKNTAAVNGIYIAFCLVPMMVISILSLSNDRFAFLLKYDVVMNIRLLAGIDTAASADIIRAFAIGAFYIIASTVGGILLFRKSEVK